MPRVKTSTFIAEFPLVVTLEQGRTLEVRLDAARNVYNAALGEALRILDRMKESKAWQQARKIKGKKHRSETFKALTEKFGFTQTALEKFTRDCRNGCWLHEHVGSAEAQAITKRALQAAQQYCYGKRGRPRFKGKRGLHSVEGKSNATGIMFRDGFLSWSGLSLFLMLDPRDRDGWQEQALACRTKYCRVIRRILRGKSHWYCQLVQEGRVPVKKRNVVSAGTVGLDIGPSTIAVVSDVQAGVQTFCPTVTEPWKAVRRINRALDRSRRATNPEHYNENGTVKPGKHVWKDSRRYKKLRGKSKEIQRRLTAERKRSHGELCNVILAQGNDIRTENISYRSFQKNFGKSVKVRGPGMFVAMLTRKAENAGGSVTLINTRTTKLSQYDHATDTYIKKPLSQRLHFFGDGWDEPVQRDLYSAFLARHCSSDSLDVYQVNLAWATAEPLLRRATSRWKQSTSRISDAGPHGHGRPSRSPVEEKVDSRRGLGSRSENLVFVRAKKSHESRDLLRTPEL